MRKKILFTSVLVVLLALALVLSGCDGKKTKDEETKKADDNQTKIEEKEQKDSAEKKKDEKESYVDELQKVDVLGGQISGILTLPAKKSISGIPAILFVPGSGAAPKNGLANEFELLAQRLAEQDIASFRYDKRGTYDSNAIQVDESKVKVSDYTKDIKTLIAHLKKDSRFSSIYVLGQSQGALFGALAIQDEKVDGFISSCGSGRQIGDVILEQIKNNKANPEELINESAEIISKLKRGEKVDEVSAPLNPLFRPSVQGYLIDWMKINPAAEYKKIEEIPTLILQGKNDIQISVEDAKILAAANPKAELILIDKMSHVLKDASTKDDLAEHVKIYSNVKAPVNEEYVKAIIDFVNAKDKKE